MNLSTFSLASCNFVLDELLHKTEKFSATLATHLKTERKEDSIPYMNTHAIAPQGFVPSLAPNTESEYLGRCANNDPGMIQDHDVGNEYRPDDQDDWDDLETFEEQLHNESECNMDSTTELRELEEEANIPIEELLRQYAASREEHDDAVTTSTASHNNPTSSEHMIRTRSGHAVATGLLKHDLRDYQMFGVRWLISCHRTGLNAILADEMGLGKTIQTISLLAHLAQHEGIWGPHLIVVPTSVMVNWEVELKKWCPALKVLTYFGTQKERKMKRAGWSKPNSFHVCITTYRLVVQDQTIFRRKRWHYLILDEAHMIKNWRSQRWQTLLTLESAHRLLITGTPLQNDVMELWSLLHFLMPELFQSHSEFKDWFSNPLLGMAEGKVAVDPKLTKRLHDVLRPFILRRLKYDVEKTLPRKHEHVVKCRLSRRQKRLYDEYMSSNETIRTMNSSNAMGVMNCLMQLRKVCNHPDLFAGRSIISSFDMSSLPSVFCPRISIQRTLIKISREIEQAQNKYRGEISQQRLTKCGLGLSNTTDKAISYILECRGDCLNRWYSIASHGYDHKYPLHGVLGVSASLFCGKTPLSFNELRCDELLLKFMFRIPKVRAQPAQSNGAQPMQYDDVGRQLRHLTSPLRSYVVRGHLIFPDARLIQFDCGKLQALASLLRSLKTNGHKVVIFTQMTKVLDIMEKFLNIHSYSYVRLDGTTKPEQRQILMQRFNTDNKIFAFILSTRSGGFGINLTGADTVIFYDSDWNPAVDAQAQDRCHRIGQTKEVNIYRMICEDTIEENIFKKALQKRELDELAIQKGKFDLDSLKHRGESAKFMHKKIFFLFFRARRRCE